MAHENGLVSVIIPTWNRASSLRRSVESALNQTLPPLEILVCDDGSTDNSEALIREIGDARVKWISGPRGGCPAIPRNRGIRESKGAWIAFLDSDDEWLPNKLQTQFDTLNERQLTAVCANAVRYVPEKGRIGNLIHWNHSRLRLKDLLADNKVICSSVLIHRELLNIIGGFPEGHELKVGEDYALWLRAASLTDFGYIETPLLVYSDDPIQSVRAESPGFFAQKKRVFSNFLAWCWCQSKLKAFSMSMLIVTVALGYLIRKLYFEFLKTIIRIREFF